MENALDVIPTIEKWIGSIEHIANDNALRQLGLLFCKSIYKKEMLLSTERKTDINRVLHSPTDLIYFTRDEIFEFTQRIGEANVQGWHVSMQERETWKQFIGGMALSYARDGDLTVVASLVRSSAMLNLNSKEIAEATRFLLDQYQPDGHFGLFTREIKHLTEVEKTHVLLRLTVDILWALAERTCQSNRCGTEVIADM